MIPVFTAGEGDGGVVAKLLREFNAEFDAPAPPQDFLARRFEELLKLDDVIVILAGPDRDSGFAYLTLRPTPYFEGPLAQLEELYVAPELRGQGIGTAMMTRMVELLRERGCEEIHINVDEPDVDARRFYERHGFSNFEAGEDYRMLCYIRELD